ncbi:RNA polymerase sigma factor [Rhizobium leguminosarum]|uniref:RNA polymerase sigma factor n=1 Tax=Rhizobium leguminosarum TaxID=384 RepID=UPI0010327B08|nr:sigma-70 family RNA polymerase sigma factor [Rhizobium leguminosarum]TBG96062.1 sigma-70 family RNA polymerase sigma factor [Rhizobium leguminosarum]
MASPLTRIKVRSSGDLYTRPTLVEAEIDHVMGLSKAERQRRGREQDPASGEFLRPETLVHLLRADLRQGGDGSPYLLTLIKRCQGNLRGTIHPNVPQAPQLRQEILQEFSLAFTREVANGSDELDFFECHFNSAFRSLRTNMFNEHMARMRRLAPQLIEPDDERSDVDIAASGSATDIWRPQQGEDAVYLREVAAFIMTFPPDERKAIALCRIKGLTQKEAGLELGVDERTIRNLLARADAKLASIKESGR